MHILASTKAGLDPRRPPVSLIANCGTGRLAGHPGVVGDLAADRVAAVAGAAEVLAGRPIRGDLQAHLTVIRAAKQPPAATPTSLREGTNLATPAIAGVASVLFAVGEVVPDDDGGLGDGRQSVRVVRPEDVSTEAREVAAGGFPMDAGPGT